MHLIDDTPDGFNRDAIGARVIVNDQYLRVKRSGQGGFLSNTFEDLHFGLADGTAQTVTVHWPDKAQTVTTVSLERLSNTTVIISKTQGLVTY